MMINIMHRFSVKPKRNYGNLDMTKVYPVLWLVKDDIYDYSYAVRGDNGFIEFIGSDHATVEDVQ